MLERELADLRRHESTTPRRARAPSTPPTDRPPRAASPVPVDELAHRGPPVSRAALVVAAVFAIAVLVLAVFVARSFRVEDRPPETACTIASSPGHARVYGITPTGREVDLGIAPVRQSFDEWRGFQSVQLRIPGYDTLTVNAPTLPIHCAAGPYDLFRR